MTIAVFGMQLGAFTSACCVRLLKTDFFASVFLAVFSSCFRFWSLFFVRNIPFSFALNGSEMLPGALIF